MNDNREQRGLALAALYRIDKTPEGKWVVPSQSGDGRTYTVDPEKRHCNCPDHEQRGVKCKHMFAVEFVITRESNPDGTETVTRTFTVTEKVTYPQNWPVYNRAQTTEKHRFQEILADLCRGVPEPLRPRMGRPPVPMAHLVFSVAYKVYSTFASRRFTCDLEDAMKAGFITRAAHFNVVNRAMEDERLTPILKALIVESSKPLASVETDFAIDSSGFSTCRFVRWFDMKYGKTMEEREWVKVHISTGVKTNVVTAVEILGKTAHDAPILPPLVGTTAETFTMKEVSADSAYSSLANMDAVAAVGAVPYIAFKENATGGVGGLFAKMYHFYNFKRDEFLEHYHKRSNVESTFSMVKAKFGDAVRSKSDTAMLNEVLCKVLCHNICCLIHSVLELGIVAKFWGEGEATEPTVTVREEGADIADAFAWV